jgi:hypothetical protein
VDAYMHDVRARWLMSRGHTARWAADPGLAQTSPDWWDLADAYARRDARPLTLCLPDGAAVLHFAFARDGFVYVIATHPA